MSSLFFRSPRLTILTLFLVFAAGMGALGTMGRQEDPSLTERFGNVVVLFPGADAERVEALITEPLEASLLELVELDEVQSASRANIAIFNVSIREDLNEAMVEQTWTMISDQVAQAEAQFPEGASRGIVTRQYLGAVTLLVSLNWPEGIEGGYGALGRLARDLQNQLRNVSGTDQVRVFGEPEEEIRVVLDPDAAASAGLTADRIAGILAQSDAKAPAGRLAGDSLDFTVEVSGAFNSLDRLRETPIDLEGSSFLRLGDIADIERGLREPIESYAYLNDTRSIWVAGYLEPGLRVSDWDARATRVVERFAEANPGVEVSIVFDQASYVSTRLNGLAANLGFSALIVFGVLFLIMGWRSALIVGAALPLTVLLVLILINLIGQPLHQMSVTGLVVSLGLLIDNAIVVVDDYRLLRSRGLERLAAVEKAVKTLFAPLLASTLTTILAFAPIALMPGAAGEFISMIGISVIFAVGSSFVLSMTVILALAAWFDDPKAGQKDSPWWRDGWRSKPLAALYRRLLDAVIAQPWVGIFLGVLLPIAGFGAATTLPSQFFPQTDRDMFQLSMILPPGVSVEMTRDVSDRATDLLKAEFPEIVDVGWVVGRDSPRVYYNVVSPNAALPNNAQGFVRTTDNASTRAIVRDVQMRLRDAFPEAQFLAIPFEQGPPINAPIELTLVGPDLAILDQLGDQLRLVLSQTPGVTYTQARIQLGEPISQLQADEAAANLAGLRLNDLSTRLRSDIDGATGGSILEGVEELPVRVIAPTERRQDIGGLGSTPFPNVNAAGFTALEVFGEFEVLPTTALISRKDGERINSIYAYLEPYALPAEILADFNERLEAYGLTLPSGYRIDVGGEAETQGEAMANLFSLAVPLLILMVAAVVLAFNSFRYAGIVFLVGFLSVGLAMFGIWLFNTPLGFNGIVGALGLVGLSINGTIVVLTALKTNEAALDGDAEAIREGVFDATRHIIATTLTTIGGFAPLLIEGDAFWLPFAAAVAGGVSGSAVLALVFAPATFVLLNRGRKRVNQAEPQPA